MACLGMKRETLRSLMSMPSLSNSPWILGAPQSTLALAICADELLDLGGDVVLRRCAGARLPAPEQAEAGAMPADHGVGLDDDEGVGPAGPDLREDNPEGAVGSGAGEAVVKSGAGWRAAGGGRDSRGRARHGCGEAERRRGEQVEKEGEHGQVAHDATGRMPPLRIPALTDGRTASRMSTWRRTAGRRGPRLPDPYANSRMLHLHDEMSGMS